MKCLILLINLLIGIMAASCDLLEQECWRQCGQPLIFPFRETCKPAPDLGVYECRTPPGCVCIIPVELRTTSTYYPNPTQCITESCINYNWNTLYEGWTKWCQACGYDCGGNQATCIANSDLCLSPARCGSLQLCRRWREAACLNGEYDGSTCDGTMVPTQVPTQVPTTVSPTRVPTTSPTTSPTAKPTTSPTRVPTAKPTTMSPTPLPSTSPTRVPTAKPTTSPTQVPTAKPTTSPFTSPTQVPTTTSPFTSPTQVPTTTSPFTSPTQVPMTQIQTTQVPMTQIRTTQVPMTQIRTTQVPMTQISISTISLESPQTPPVLGSNDPGMSFMIYFALGCIIYLSFTCGINQIYTFYSKWKLAHPVTTYVSPMGNLMTNIYNRAVVIPTKIRFRSPTQTQTQTRDRDLACEEGQTNDPIKIKPLDFSRLPKPMFRSADGLDLDRNSDRNLTRDRTRDLDRNLDLNRDLDRDLVRGLVRGLVRDRFRAGSRSLSRASASPRLQRSVGSQLQPARLVVLPHPRGVKGRTYFKSPRPTSMESEESENNFIDVICDMSPRVDRGDIIERYYKEIERSSKPIRLGNTRHIRHSKLRQLESLRMESKQKESKKPESPPAETLRTESLTTNRHRSHHRRHHKHSKKSSFKVTVQYDTDESETISDNEDEPSFNQSETISDNYEDSV